ncbi:MAG: type II toxin-antitoxin system VapC family toxin [Candidatus Scalindua sp.]
MKIKKGNYIFDSYSLLTYFQKEEGFDKVIKLLDYIKKNKLAMYLNAINLGELVYITKREFGDQKKLEILANIKRLNFTILPITNSLIFKAAEYKADYPMSYADCFALASAIEHKAMIVTGDPDFKRIEHLVKIIWI